MSFLNKKIYLHTVNLFPLLHPPPRTLLLCYGGGALQREDLPLLRLEDRLWCAGGRVVMQGRPLVGVRQLGLWDIMNNVSSTNNTDALNHWFLAVKIHFGAPKQQQGILRPVLSRVWTPMFKTGSKRFVCGSLSVWFSVHAEAIGLLKSMASRQTIKQMRYGQNTVWAL